jgi:hypothetical protein
VKIKRGVISCVVMYNTPQIYVSQRARLIQESQLMQSSSRFFVKKTYFGNG